MCSNVWPDGAKVKNFRGRQKRSTTNNNGRATTTRQTAPPDARKIQTTMDRFLTSEISSKQQFDPFSNITIRKKKNRANSCPTESNFTESENESETEIGACDIETETTRTEEVALS